MHSAFDLSPKLYNFAQWLNSPEFVSPKKGYTGVEASSDQPPVQEQAALNLSMSLIFANYNSTNGVFDNQGNRIGYETKSPEGVTNIFDNNGNRLGYVPPRHKQ